MIGDQGNTRAVPVISGALGGKIGRKDSREARKSDDGGCQRGRGARTQRKQERQTGRNFTGGNNGNEGQTTNGGGRWVGHEKVQKAQKSDWYVRMALGSSPARCESFP
jgi:hypothetical protein